MAYLEEAAEHAKRSIKGANVAEVHGHARLAAGMLVAASRRGGAAAQDHEHFPPSSALETIRSKIHAHSTSIDQ